MIFDMLYMYIYIYINCRYYSHLWLSEDCNWVPPHRDIEFAKRFKTLFLDMDARDELI